MADDSSGRAQAKDHPASVVIVDDDRILCELLEGRLDDEPGLACVGTAITPEEARSIVEREQPSIILVDVRLGTGVDAIELTADLVALSPSSQVLIWTKWTDTSPNRAEEIRQRVRATHVGATDWIAKGDGIDNLIDRIRAAILRGPIIPPQADERSPIERSLREFLDDFSHRREESNEAISPAALTPAEERAARIVARGLELGFTIDRIADINSMKAETLRTHLKRIYTKWGVHGQAAFVAEARRRGLC
jgi:DNA-binding NarL/FixJ family response regulator